MGCACNKRQAAGQTADAKAREARAAEAKARTASAPGPSAKGTTSHPVMHGTTQSFAMESNGRTARFGSKIERDAAVARTGGRPL